MLDSQCRLRSLTPITLWNKQIKFQCESSVWMSFESVQEEIELMEGEEEVFAESRQTFQTLYYELKASLNSKIPRSASPVLSRRIPESVVPPVNPTLSVKLPELKLPEFHGNPEEWIEFRDLFKSVIHMNNLISPVQKLNYLRGSLKGEASRIISSIAISADNYAIAWKAICDRYENKNFLIKRHMSAILKIPAMRRESAVGLAELADEFNRHVGILDKLEQSSEHWNSFLVEHLSSLLDEKSLMEWETQCQEQESPTYFQLYEFIHKRSRMLQKCKVLTNTNTSVQMKNTRGKSSASHVVSENVVKCLSCKQAHQLSQCPTFLKLTPNSRLDFVKTHRLCINCLRSGHLAKDCRSSVCRSCAKKHHTLLHLPPRNFNGTTSEEVNESETPQTCIAVSTAVTTNTSSAQSFLVSRAPPVVRSCASNSSSPVTHTRSSGESSFGLLSRSEEQVVECPLLASQQYSSSFENEPPSPQEQPTSLTQVTSPENATIFLSTALVRILDRHGNYHLARALLDSGSQSNFISESLCQHLDLKRNKINLPICGIGQATVNVHYKVHAKITSRFNQIEFTLDCLVLPKLTVCLPSRNVNISDWKMPRNISLADPKFNITHGIDLLIGAELFFSLLESHQILLGEGLPLLQRTVLGYVVSGKSISQSVNTSICNTAIMQPPDLNEQLERFWQVDNFDVGKALTADEKEVETHFEKTFSRSDDGRYVVRLPLREELVPLLGDSYSTAVRRFLLLEKRLSADQQLREDYEKFMQEYVMLGHMEVCRRVAGPQFFLPHHAVRRPDNTTTKTRVVFDASCKASGQLSLNDVLHTGPMVQPALLSTVLNFRKPKYVFTADIEKMFRQVWVHPNDRKYQQIIWRKDPSLPPQVYQLKTVTYGLASSPYHAARVLNQLAADYHHDHPLASSIVKHRTYVDDTLAGYDDLAEATEACRQLVVMLKIAGFTLRKWCSNQPKVLENVPEELWNHSSKTEIGQSTTTTKTLGLLWNLQTDTFSFKIPSLCTANPVTKLVNCKVFVQRLWAASVEWDAPLSEDDRSWWNEFRDGIQDLQRLSIPRRVLANVDNEFTLHCFCDASERAYGCCVYVVSKGSDDRTHSQLLIAQSRVAPLRNLTIPRLELCAAVLASQMMEKLRTTTEFDGPTVFWSDSTVVLHWIRSPPPDWKPFVSNKIAEIQRSTKNSQWRHIRTDVNPADILSRGAWPSQILDNDLWWHGPDFLVAAPEFWPPVLPTSNLQSVDRDEMNIEKRQRYTVAMLATPIDDSLLSRFAELSRLLKVVAWCLRFYHNFRLPVGFRRVGVLTPSEIEDALKALIRLEQASGFQAELHQVQVSKKSNTPLEIHAKSPLKGMNILYDSEGFLRLDGRLRNLNKSFDSKHPYILPADGKLSLLLARSLHLQTAHSGPSLLLATMRQRFWPLQGRILVRKIVRNYVTFFRCRPTLAHQQMGPLPAVRLTPARVFSRCGLDYCGPFNVRPLYGRGASLKMYVAVFVCLSVKAVHFEVVPNLTSSACINAIKRFVGRRGRLHELHCDNATTFVGANTEMKAIRQQYLQQFRTNQWDNYCLDSDISFHFIPARSPHFGGLWEAGVKSFKYHSRRIFGGRSYTYDEFSTAVAK
ncbi:uncharacterized protein LOC129743475 [Uranotaenia lowii]|uniref:uncharacterized protein LOC129743475 n=1 Tax=Uranotaenia lowii TaxID=190385 RepID=UPI00247ACF40|nr:uncharacterized protein LOC129743475 [Uranotaenia lowii]